MNVDKFNDTYNQPRNGANFFVRHPLVRYFQLSDGVHECAEAGCWWLIDIAATELPQVMRNARESMVTLTASVAGSKAVLSATGSGDRVLKWRHTIGFTDMPAGDWQFLVADEGERVAMVLVSEY